MDTCKVEPLGAKAQTKPTRTEDNPRPSHEKNDTIPSNAKPRIVASRYMNGISSTPVSASGASRRCSSPIASQSRTNRVPGVSMSKRSHSAYRRRSRTPSSKSSALSSPSRPSTPSTPSSRPTTPVRAVVTEYHKTTRQLLSNKAPDGLWPSIRSLSSSFQSESLTVPVNKREKLAAKSSTVKSINLPSNVVSERKRTPLRGMNTSDQSENSKPAENSNTKVVDRHRWPSTMGGKLSTSAMSRSMDLSDKISRPAGRVTSQVIFPNKIDLTSSSASGHPKLSLSNEVEQLSNNGSGSIEQNVKPVVNLSSQATMKSSSVTRPTSTQSSFILGQQRPSSPSTQSSIIPGLLRPSTPSKVLSSSSSFTSRAMLSPLRTRASTPISLSSTIFGTLGGTSFVSKSSTDGKIGKLHASDIEDAHQLKLLSNASLQWCFVNAQTNKTLSIQKMRTENVLQSVWNNISTMGNSVLMKRIEVQHLHQEMKLGVVLKGQMMSLEQWAALGEEHCSSLSGTIEALNTSILRLPVMGGTKADVIDMRNAVSSAIDMMHAISSSICLLLSKVECTKSLVSELQTVAAKEKLMLDECRELLACATSMQVQESSLRTQLMLLKNDACNLHQTQS
ncbi:AUGMIN subunit 8-like isoform X1 [Zingiber officinale]|uniref:AUGMIN subunit 8-like isoform X1 n=1 Tax=Zingiber officinale TaxID=94328 RepID=UPI001C4D98D0|nr:AUGMIN subunit 8-like isoform X1 [Zingiber officinale]XP_042468261.1 AUGMIN subunit 8-like isoform X1 [Zingiber officinale]